MYKVGEYIHHANRGICQVEEITTMKTDNKSAEKKYYKLIPLESTASTLFTPVDNPKVMMRRVMTREDAEKLIGEIPAIRSVQIPDERKLESFCRAQLASVDCKDWVGLIKTLYHRRKKRLDAGKKVAASEEKYFQSATERLNTELAMAIGILPEAVDDYIAAHIS